METIHKTLDVAFAQPADYEAINALFNLAFHKDRSLAEYSRKFLESPWGPPIPSAVVCRIDAQIVGSYGMLLHRLSARDETIDAIQVVDVCVHPEFTRRGVNRACLNFFLAQAPKYSQFAFGFPGYEYAGVGLNKLGHRPVTSIVGYIYLREAGAGYEENAGDGDVTIEVAKHVPPEWVGCLAKLSQAFAIYTERTLEYMRWRYRRSDESRFAFVFLKKGSDVEGCATAKLVEGTELPTIWIYEFIAFDYKSISRLLDSLSRQLCGERRHQVIFWCNEYCPWQREFERYGFKKNEHGLGQVVAVHLGGYIDRLEFMFNPREWFLTMGDSDL